MEAPDMSSIFISHSSKDHVIAAELRTRLVDQGYRSVFLDFDPEIGIPSGRNWEKELYLQLRSSQAVIAVCSGHYSASPWCFAEMTQARALGKHLFPIKAAHCEIPPLLRDVQITDFTLDQAEGYRRLWAGLETVGLDQAAMYDWDDTRPPYPGLLAFDELDAAVYFGRNDAIQAAIESLSRLQRLAARG
jgi:hypothetical protein